MRLINVYSFELEEFHDCTQVKYAILSHRWEEQEVLFKDMVHANGSVKQLTSMKGWYKIERSCKEAATRNYEYVWVDTCCIDKSSSAELQEAINSMFRWYACAEICFAFLSDVQWSTDASTFDRSQWFERGWTLQELLAPRHLVFFDSNWQRIDSRKTMATRISTITGIPDRFLYGSFNPNWQSKTRPCIAAVMSWASNRKTTRLEDRAYSLLGLFDVNMPMLYGEGEKAFYRLQVELLQQNEDQSIFAWDDYDRAPTGLLAVSPRNFKRTKATALLSCKYVLTRRFSSRVSSEGVHVEVILVPVYSKVFMALFNLTFLECDQSVWLGPSRGAYSYNGVALVGIYVYKLGDSRFARIPSPLPDSTTDLAHWPAPHGISQVRTITVVRRLEDHELYHTRQKSNTMNLDGLPREGEGSPLEDEIKLDVLPGRKNLWTTWCENKAVDLRCVRGDDLPHEACQYAFDEHMQHIQLQGSVCFSLIRTRASKGFPFSSFVVGFDFESNFFCSVSMTDSTAFYIRNSYQKLLCLPDEEFDSREPYPDQSISVSLCTGGRYRIMGPQTVAFKKRRFVFDRPMLVRVRTGADTSIQFGVNQTTPQLWSVYIDVADSLSFMDAVERASTHRLGWRPDASPL